jgi:beta-lactamase superfamily II metal-dependent hydrolase
VGGKMYSCTVHFIPAEAGDCLVLEFSNRDCIIIDGGYKSTYKNELKPLLIKLKEKGCKVILLIVTHIDQDHIEGAIELIKENGEATNPQIIKIENIWFNGFFNTLFMNDIFSEHRKKVVEEKQKEKVRLVKAELNMQKSSVSGNISAKHSQQFEELCVEYGYVVNKQFSNHTVMRTSEDVEVVVNNKVKLGDCFFTVLSPNKMLLDKLAKDTPWNLFDNIVE